MPEPGDLLFEWSVVVSLVTVLSWTVCILRIYVCKVGVVGSAWDQQPGQHNTSLAGIV